MKPRALIVEDNEISQNLLGTILLKEGMSVCVASTCRQALDAVKEDYPDLVFVDFQLPDSDGACLTAALRARHPQILCYAVTGDSRDETITAFTRAGIEGVILKPFSVEQVQQIARDIVETKRNEARNAISR